MKIKIVTLSLVVCFATTTPTKAVTLGAEENSTVNASAPGDTLAPADDYKFRIGGYGEVMARTMDYGLNRWTGTSNGSTRINHGDISIPRFIIAMDYKFNKRWSLGAEIEFEAGGTGIEYELETGPGSENGEYETEVEKGGEVALEQFHITYTHARWLNIRAGHMIVPVGLTNSHHEPIFFFGTRRRFCPALGTKRDFPLLVGWEAAWPRSIMRHKLWQVLIRMGLTSTTGYRKANKAILRPTTSRVLPTFCEWTGWVFKVCALVVACTT